MRKPCFFSVCLWTPPALSVRASLLVSIPAGMNIMRSRQPFCGLNNEIALLLKQGRFIGPNLLINTCARYDNQQDEQNQDNACGSKKTSDTFASNVTHSMRPPFTRFIVILLGKHPYCLGYVPDNKNWALAADSLSQRFLSMIKGPAGSLFVSLIIHCSS